MAKCKTCRDKDVELLTRWERIKNWLFYKVNYTFFTDDFNDLTSQKYTQGFSDGRTAGIEAEKTSYARYKELYDVEKPKMSEDQLKQALSNLLSPVDLNKVVKVDKAKGIVYIGDKRLEENELQNLKSEADFIANSEIWALLYETPKELAQQSMFVNGDNLESMQKGRSILYTLSTQNNIINVFRSYVKK